MSANQVTTLRLLPMPVMAWLFYQGADGWWVALVLGTIIGSTDYLDGYLARKHGPTVLGGLLDPIADKVFVALTWLPFVDVGAVPAWPIALLFVREFLVTALRSAYAQRELHLKTSYLGKVKTWVQMQGIGLTAIVLLLAEHRALLLGFIGAAAAIPALIGAVLWVVQRRFRRGPWVMAGFVLVMLLLCLPRDPTLTATLTAWVIAGVTWLSGLDYLVVGLPRLKRAGGFGRAEAVRVLGAIAVPLLAVAALTETPVHPAPVLAVVALELSAGGVDNLLSVHGRPSGAAAWGGRVLAVSVLLAAALVVPESADLFAAGAAAVSLAGAALDLRRASRYF